MSRDEMRNEIRRIKEDNQNLREQVTRFEALSEKLREKNKQAQADKTVYDIIVVTGKKK